MKGDVIPESDDIARHVKGSYLQPDGRVSLHAFMLRHDKGEEYLSISWLDNWKLGSIEKNLEETRKAFRRKSFDLRRSARFAVAQVGAMRRSVAEASQGETVTVLHKPEDPKDLSHSGIYGTDSIESLEEAMVAEIIAGVIPPDHIFPAIA